MIIAIVNICECTRISYRANHLKRTCPVFSHVGVEVHAACGIACPQVASSNINSPTPYNEPNPGQDQPRLNKYERTLPHHILRESIQRTTMQEAKNYPRVS